MVYADAIDEADFDPPCELFLCSAWNLLLVVLMGVACLVLGWALASCKGESIPTWLRTLRPLWRSLRRVMTLP